MKAEACALASAGMTTVFRGIEVACQCIRDAYEAVVEGVVPVVLRRETAAVGVHVALEAEEVAAVVPLLATTDVEFASGTRCC